MSGWDHATYYCQVPSWWPQYDVPILLLVQTLLNLVFHRELMIRGSIDDQTRVWIIALTEYVFVYSAMFVINARDGVCSR